MVPLRALRLGALALRGGTMADQFIVYALTDPRTGEWRYIGKTEGDLRIRLYAHVYEATRARSNTHKTQWIRSLVNRGLRPGIEVVSRRRSAETLAQAEVEWIALCRRSSVPLTNVTDGGEGTHGYRHSLEVRDRISERLAGRPSPRRGVPLTRETRLKVSRTKTGLSARDQRDIVALYKQGEGSDALARGFGVSRTCVSSLLRIYGVQPRAPGSTRRKVTPSQERKAVQLYARGHSSAVVASELGISARTVLNILERRGITPRARAGFYGRCKKGQESRPKNPPGAYQKTVVLKPLPVK